MLSCNRGSNQPIGVLRRVNDRYGEICLHCSDIQKGATVNDIGYNPIGIIHSPFKDPQGIPIQAAAAGDIEGTIDIHPEYAEGLADVQGFSHIILIYHFHLSKGSPLQVKPYLDNKLRGVFATRSPVRPNPIGVSVVRLVKIEGTRLHIRDADIVDCTPLLDIKHYVPEFDMREVSRIGWLEGKVSRLHSQKDDGRFI